MRPGALLDLRGHRVHARPQHVHVGPHALDPVLGETMAATLPSCVPAASSRAWLIPGCSCSCSCTPLRRSQCIPAGGFTGTQQRTQICRDQTGLPADPSNCNATVWSTSQSCDCADYRKPVSRPVLSDSIWHALSCAHSLKLRVHPARGSSSVGLCVSLVPAGCLSAFPRLLTACLSACTDVLQVRQHLRGRHPGRSSHSTALLSVQAECLPARIALICWSGAVGQQLDCVHFQGRGRQQRDLLGKTPSQHRRGCVQLN